MKPVDGLRGIAVLMVVAYHAWWYVHNPASAIYRPSQSWVAAFLLYPLGHEGVSLFLVLSGFCLAHGPLHKRAAGIEKWFSLPSFARSRCRRILPPYYTALALCTALSVVGGPGLRHALFACMGDPTPANIAEHVALVHNLTSNLGSINGAFWSLGLEAQWYLVFPLILYCAVWWGWRAVAGAVLIAMTWAIVGRWAVPHHILPDRWFFEPLQPILMQRLYEFACGVAVAQLAVRGWTMPRRAVVPLCAVLPLFLIGWYVLLPWGLPQLASGTMFALLLHTVNQSQTMQRALSCRTLSCVGAASYSIYLIHAPIVQGTMYIGRHVVGTGVIGMACGAGCGLAAGFGFFGAVERPLLRWRSHYRAEPAPSLAGAE